MAPSDSDLAACRAELARSREQMAATSEVLRLIAQSPGDLRRVFDSIAEQASRLVGADQAGILQLRDGRFSLVAAHGASAEFVAYLREHPPALDAGTVSGLCVLERQSVYIEDTRADPRCQWKEAARLGEYRTTLGVPLLGHGSEPLGALWVAHRSVRAFRPEQVALIAVFADQAAIAIERASMFTESQSRERALADALGQQTATAEVLRMISRSTTDAQPVFDAIAAAALELCEARSVNVFTFDGRLLHLAAMAIADAGSAEAMRSVWPRPPGRDAGAPRAVESRRVVQIHDVLADPDFVVRDVAVAAGFRSVLAVPLLRGGEPVGAIAIGRPEPGPFAATQVALLQTFADQAAIAIENARLFNELQARNRELAEALDQHTATAEILRVISRSPTDLAPVFEAVAASVARLVDAPDVVILEVEDGRLRHAASVGIFGATIGAELDLPLDRSNVCGVALVDRKVVHVEDLAAVTDPEMVTARAIQRRYGQRTMVAAPMLHGEVPLGTIAVLRPDVRPFTPRQIALLQTFADQVVIAIRNAHLFDALQARTAELEEQGRQLEIASRHKSTFLANMSHELRTPLNAIIGFTRIVRRRSADRLDAQQTANLEKILASALDLLSLINAVLDLAKVEAGRIEVATRPLDLAGVLDDGLRTVEPLVAAGVRLVHGFDAAALPPMVGDEDKVRRIVVNLLANAAKFTSSGRIELGVRSDRDMVEIAVTDTGIGIAADKLELIFDEFEQAEVGTSRPHGGTGLGLAISRRLARLMRGDIEVRSVPGVGSTFTLRLPLQPGEAT